MRPGSRRVKYWEKADTFAFMTAREDEIFEKYMELGNYMKVVDWIGEQMEGEGGTSYTVWYAWLHETDARWEKWQESMKARSYISADEALEITENSEQNTANRDRLRYEGKMRAAEHQNRAVFGKNANLNITHTVGDDWLEALKQVELAAIEEAEVLEEETLALPAGEDGGNE